MRTPRTTTEAPRSPQVRKAILTFAATCLGFAACSGDAGNNGEAAGQPESTGATSLVLITLDTTNARALDMYAKDRGVSPALLALARESQVFDAARTVAPLTLPAHASMMTGLVPPRHGVRDNGLGALPAEARTLAEIAQESGRSTAAFVSAAVIDSQFGLDQGFDHFSGPSAGVGPQSAGDYMVERRGEETVDEALAWLGEQPEGEPFFLWVHLFDPHAPYEPPADAMANANSNLYLGEVAAMDRAVGRLLAALPPASSCGVIVAADHGESLGRHGEPTHSLLIHDATMLVPFMVRWPGGRAAAERSAAPVSVCDVFPTSLAILGLEDEGGHDGVSLVDPPGADRAVYFESYSGYIAFGLAPLAGIADGRGKWIGGPGSRFYPGTRLPMDPQNAEGVPGDGPESEEYRRALEVISGRPALLAGAVKEGAGDAMRALGYAGAGTLEQVLPTVLVDTGRPSVPEGLADALACYEAVTVAGVGRRREAIQRLQTIYGRSPGNTMAGQMLGSLLLEENRVTDADRVISRLVERGNAGPDVLKVLGDVRFRQGRFQEAKATFKQALAARPGDAKLRRRLASASERAGQ